MFSIGIGIGTKNEDDAWLEVFYPSPLLQPSADLIEGLSHVIDFSAGEGLFPLDEAARVALCDCIEHPGQLALLKTLQNSPKPCVLTLSLIHI